MNGFSANLVESIPDIEDIATKWREAFRCSPIELRKNLDFRYYGGLIFASSLMKRCSIELDKKRSDEERHLYSEWPKLDKAFRGKFCYKFKTLDGANKIETFMILSHDGQRVEEFIYLDHTNKTQHFLSTIEEVLHAM